MIKIALAIAFICVIINAYLVGVDRGESNVQIRDCKRTPAMYQTQCRDERLCRPIKRRV